MGYRFYHYHQNWLLAAVVAEKNLCSYHQNRTTFVIAFIQNIKTRIAFVGIIKTRWLVARYSQDKPPVS